MNLIEFSAQIGYKTDKRFQQYHSLLNSIFYTKRPRETKEPSEYFHTLLFLSIVFRVAGDPTDFDGGEGPEFLKKSRGKPIYTIDLVIPARNWQEKTDAQLREYVAKGVRDCFSLLREKAIKAKEVIDLEKLDADFEYGMGQFLTLPLPELPKY